MTASEFATSFYDVPLSQDWKGDKAVALAWLKRHGFIEKIHPATQRHQNRHRMLFQSLPNHVQASPILVFLTDYSYKDLRIGPIYFRKTPKVDISKDLVIFAESHSLDQLALSLSQGEILLCEAEPFNTVHYIAPNGSFFFDALLYLNQVLNELALAPAAYPGMPGLREKILKLAAIAGGRDSLQFYESIFSNT